MHVKDTARKQYQTIVDAAATATLCALRQPEEGWIASVRQALGISAADLGRIVNQTRANISRAERSERNGRATLQSLHKLAEAMGCKFVYAIVPAEGSIEDVLERQARKKARALVEEASMHMALEQQALSEEQREAEVARLAQGFLRDPPADFWSDA